ncbi:MAG TPA: endonuclease III [Candidatus Binatia bacterium]|nr:endonuclease III [Candidatus Binatia bacterium]
MSRAEASAPGPREEWPRRRKREALQAKSARAQTIAARLAAQYPSLECPLVHRNTFELLIAVILSAQCTDAAVNQVTPELFRHYPDARKLSQASTQEIERYIRRLGLYRGKAKSLQTCARQLLEEFGGEVPSTMEELIRLAGVGRKTANVILGHAFKKPGVAVDTHCRRLSNRLGLTKHQDPAGIEKDLCRLLPAEEWTAFSHRVIIHGRKMCFARKPACNECPLSDLCPSSSAMNKSGD